MDPTPPPAVGVPNLDMGQIVTGIVTDTLSSVFYSVAGQIMVVAFLVRALLVVWPVASAFARNAAAISASRAR